MLSNFNIYLLKNELIGAALHQVLTINQIFKINLIVKQATVNQKYEVTP